MAKIESVVKTPEGPTGAGTTIRIRQRVLGRSAESTTRVSAVEPDRKIEWDARVGPMPPHAAFDLQPADNGTLRPRHKTSREPGRARYRLRALPDPLLADEGLAPTLRPGPTEALN
jgi:hypothetical protein